MTPPTPGRSGHGKGSRRGGEALGQGEGAKVIPYAPKGRDGDKHQNNSEKNRVCFWGARN